ncbi:ABC transporter permease subunit [Proteus vulgaris]|uniref:nickel/cobalt ABC transporter permease n=1 Tax=Proteus TaxID=583 RepID=UPI000D686FBD|nr:MULTISPECIES: nickel/cobalt ABC transporter permease [Proteus]MBQ0212802.1 ABC transporter permease subunit [Proteus vulgaris]MDS0787238.1 ABC transporter permease subunit [Proteus vulgaris]NBM53401.1 ABC transporter permease subunit [Proteus sp. G2669]UDN35912.1 ABC transporter permease subunit [Proteus sp. NMG38-2]UPK80978.1 ABC transporter permease subunit [Proteus vulgaris]
MLRYIFWRVLAIFPLALMISFIAFILLELAPSDPAEVALRVNEIVPTPEAIDGMRHELGLDKPFFTRYFLWLMAGFQLDFGTSFLTRTPVIQEMLRALPPTLWLASTALFFTIILALPLALWCVAKPQSFTDKCIRFIVFVLTAIPNYWLGLLLIWGVAVYLDWLPVSGMLSPQSVILPALALSLGYIGTYLRLLRGAMLNQWHQPYVFYAKARGLPDNLILRRHILRNSLYSSLTALGMSIPKLIAGTVVIENIFAWPGIGRLCISAIFGRDYPMIQAYILLMSLLFLFFNFLMDVIQMMADPRLRR